MHYQTAFILKIKGSSDIFHDAGELEDILLNKPGTKKQVLHDLLFVKTSNVEFTGKEG